MRLVMRLVMRLNHEAYHEAYRNTKLAFTFGKDRKVFSKSEILFTFEIESKEAILN